MERVLKFRDIQHEEDRVMKLHGNSGHQTDSGIDQNDNNNDDDSNDSDDDQTRSNGQSRKSKKDNEKRRRRRRAKKKNKSSNKQNETSNDDEKSDMKTSEEDEIDPNSVQIEYVQEEIPVKRGDSLYTHFAKVFENFKLEPDADENGEYHYNKYGKKIPGPKVILPRDKTNLDDNEDDDTDGDQSNAGQDKKGKDGKNADDDMSKKSKKQVKRDTRYSVAKLKTFVNRPDVVEMFDVTAKDPIMLVHLKVT